MARSGQHAPGTPAGVNFNFADLYEILEPVSQRRRPYYVSILSLRRRRNERQRIRTVDGRARRPRTARPSRQPGSGPAGWRELWVYDPRPGLNDAGQIIFASLLSGSGVDSSNDKSVWSDVSGSLALVARKGSQAPGLPSGVTFDNLFDTGAINNAGQIAFVAGLSNQSSMYKQDSIWLYDSGSMTPLFVRGEHPPGTPAGVTYELFGFWPALNEAGQVLTGALLAGSGVDASNQLAVYLSDAAGNEKLILRTGDQAPGAPPGVVFYATFESFAEGMLNDRGQVAIGQHLAGAGVDSTNDFGIWATDSTGALQLIAREGDQLEVAPGDFRTISESKSYRPQRQQQRLAQRLQQPRPARLLGQLHRRLARHLRLEQGGHHARRFQQRRHRRRRRLRRLAQRPWHAVYAKSLRYLARQLRSLARFRQRLDATLRRVAVGRRTRARVARAAAFGDWRLLLRSPSLGRWPKILAEIASRFC